MRGQNYNYFKHAMLKTYYSYKQKRGYNAYSA